MIRFLLRTVINLVDAALALLLAAWIIEGVSLDPVGFVVAVVIFTAAQAILAPFVFNLARKHASAVLGGIGLVSTFLALWVATLFDGGLTIDGLTAWILAPLVVWIVTALAGWILGALIVDRWWQRRQDDRTTQRALAKASRRKQ